MYFRRINYENDSQWWTHLWSIITFFISMVFLFAGVGGSLLYWHWHPEYNNTDSVILSWSFAIITMGVSLTLRWAVFTWSDDKEPANPIVTYVPTIRFRTILLIAATTVVLDHLSTIKSFIWLHFFS